MKLTLNPYALIIKDSNRLIFILSDTDNPIVVEFTEKHLQMLKKMHEGEFIEYEVLCRIFGEKVIRELFNSGCFLQTRIDTESLFSRTDAFFMSHNMPIAREKLKNKKVLILGCGGIGTHMAWHMVTLGIEKLTIVDFDTVEKSNFNRQLIFDNFDIGKEKVNALKEKLSAINPDIKIEAIVKCIESEKDLENICTSDKYDLVIKALDTPTNFPIWLDKVAQRYQLPYITGITMRENVLIGPSFIPGKSQYGLSELMGIDGTETSEKLYGISPSLGIMLYNISDELSVEAFKILTGYGAPKYIDTVLCRNILTDERHYLGNPNRLEKNSNSSTPENSKKELLLDIIVMIILAVAGICQSFFIPVSFVAAISLPLLIYKSSNDVVRCAFLNASIFSIGLLVTLISTINLTTSIAFISSVSILFSIHSALILLICSITHVFNKVFNRKNLNQNIKVSNR